MLYGNIYWACGEAFALAGVATILFTPVVGKLAIRFGVIDKPNHRKVHVRTIPRMGGAAVFFGILLSLGLLDFLSPTVHALIAQNSKAVACLAGGAALLFCVGAVDDIRNVSPRTKLIFQALAGLLAFYGGFHFLLFRGSHPGAVAGTGAGMIGLVFSMVLTVCWTIGTTNAVNLIDGLDGLASGITGIAFTLLGVISIRNDRMAAALLAFVSAGAAFGFLWHNRHPAKIFLGDAGSLLLGFLLATLSISGTQQGSLAASLAGPLCLLYIPIIDTVLAMVRRTQKGLPFSFADKHHIHHRLLQKGIRHPHVVLILWGVTLGVGGVALLLHFVADSYRSVFVNLFAVVILVAIVTILGNLELFQYLKSLRNINRRKLTPRDQVLSLRRHLVGLDKRTSAESLLKRITGLAEKLELDSVAVFLAHDSEAGQQTQLFRWERYLHELGASQDWAPEPPEMTRVSAAAPCDRKERSSVIVEVGKQSWKFRRKSEDIQLWAKLVADKIAPLPALRALYRTITESSLSIQETR